MNAPMGRTFTMLKTLQSHGKPTNLMVLIQYHRIDQLQVQITHLYLQLNLYPHTVACSYLLNPKLTLQTYLDMTTLTYAFNSSR